MTLSKTVLLALLGLMMCSGISAQVRLGALLGVSRAST
jgi:hypothetical protein